MTAKKIKVTRWQCTCDKCQKEWQSRTEERPTICPFCKTKLWDKPKKKKVT